MIPRTAQAVVLAAVVALLGAACGSGDGDDADNTAPTPAPTSAATDLFTQVEDGGAPTDDDAVRPDSTDDPGEATSTSVGATATTAADGEPSERSGDATSGSTASREGPTTIDTAQGGPGPAGPGDDREDVDPDGGDGLADVGVGAGTGLVTVDGVAYPFDTDICMAGSGDFIVEGPGTTVEGLLFWGAIRASSEFDFDGDGTPDEALDVLIQVGKEEPLGSGSPDLPNLSATKLAGASAQVGDDIEYSIDGTRISGSGPIEDFNAVLAPLGDTLPMTFEASCA